MLFPHFRVPLLRLALLQLKARQELPRLLEDQGAMENPRSVAAYGIASESQGSMAPMHLFHLRGAAGILSQAKEVVDIACGTGELLCDRAALHPQARFTGVDLSQAMLDHARGVARARGLENVRFVSGDARSLSFLRDRSVDAVLSTMALHHFPSLEDLHLFFREVDRILVPSGGVYLADFARLRSEETIRTMANQYQDTECPEFIRDYYLSLRAAFLARELKSASALIRGTSVRFHCSFPFPFLAVLRSAAPAPSSAVIEQLRKRYRAMEPSYRADYMALRMAFFFRI